ncbi:MAG: GIY-YIG nuclease family protein [Rhodospirillales bacterium]
MKKSGCVYIMASGMNGTLYIGVTSDLVKRVWEHRTDPVDGFTAKYGCKKLVYFEQFDDITAAIVREKAMKKWNRIWKLKRINAFNPTWRDLWFDIATP